MFSNEKKNENANEKMTLKQKKQSKINEQPLFHAQI